MLPYMALSLYFRRDLSLPYTSTACSTLSLSYQIVPGASMKYRGLPGDMYLTES